MGHPLEGCGEFFCLSCAPDLDEGLVTDHVGVGQDPVAVDDAARLNVDAALRRYLMDSICLGTSGK